MKIAAPLFVLLLSEKKWQVEKKSISREPLGVAAWDLNPGHKFREQVDIPQAQRARCSKRFSVHGFFLFQLYLVKTCIFSERSKIITEQSVLRNLTQGLNLRVAEPKIYKLPTELSDRSSVRSLSVEFFLKAIHIAN
jgi:hypothetical protein